MRDRRFSPGWSQTVGGIAFRVVEGRKLSRVPGHIDLRLDWHIDGLWRPVTLDPVFLIVDMVSENEDFLYPYPQRGGEEVIQYLRTARTAGFRKAIDKLHRARQAKQDRLEEVEAS